MGPKYRSNDRWASPESRQQGSVVVPLKPRSGVHERSSSTPSLSSTDPFANDEQDDEVTTVHLKHLLRPPALPKAPSFGQDPPELLRVGMILDCNQLAQLWVQEDALTAQSVYVWSDVKQSWVSLMALPQVCLAIAEARQQMGNDWTLVPSLASASAAAPHGFAIQAKSRPELQVRPALTLRPPALTRSLVAAVTVCAQWLHRNRRRVSRLTARAPWLVAGATFCSRWLRRAGGYLEQIRAALATRDTKPARWVAAAVTTFSLAAIALPLTRQVQRIGANSGTASPVAKVRAATLSALPSLTRSSSTAVVEPGQSTSSEENTAVPIESLPLVDQIELLPLVAPSPPSAPHVGYRARPAGTSARMAATSHVALSSTGSKFDAANARRALESAAWRTRRCTRSPMSGTVIVSFEPTGAVSDVSLSSFAGDASRTACVLHAFQAAKIAPFAGRSVRVRKSFAVNR